MVRISKLLQSRRRNLQRGRALVTVKKESDRASVSPEKQPSTSFCENFKPLTSAADVTFSGQGSSPSDETIHESPQRTVSTRFHSKRKDSNLPFDVLLKQVKKNFVIIEQHLEKYLQNVNHTGKNRVKLPEFYDELREISAERQVINPTYVCSVGLEEIRPNLDSRPLSVSPAISEALQKNTNDDDEIIIEEPITKRKKKRVRPPTRMESVQNAILELVDVSEHDTQVEKEKNEHSKLFNLKRQKVDEEFCDLYKARTEVIKSQTSILKTLLDVVTKIDEKIDKQNDEIKKQNDEIKILLQRERKNRKDPKSHNG